MKANTINDDVTMAGEGARALLMNRYRIIKQLGQGGMGSVWLAEDTQLDGKLFAIKMLPSILVSNKRAYQQLKAEALVSMKLVHANIVTLRAFEENDGNPFLVMDYIDGQTLDEYLAERMVSAHRHEDKPIQGIMTESEVVSLLKPVAEALDYAHSKGVVHRDIKPGNVMIDKDGHPFVLDFGIAREIQETMTRVTGKMSSGTLLYMSPEQLRGQAPKAPQDVYSFAAMVYECLKGEPPFSRGQVEYQILNELPESLPENISISLSVMAALAKTPEERPKSCMAVLTGEVKTSSAIPNRSKTIVRTEKERKAKEAAVDTQSVRQKEVAELNNLRTMITIKVDDAKGRMEKVEAYRADIDGFKPRLDNIDANWKIIQEAPTSPATIPDAKAALKKLTDADTAIAQDLAWLRVNKEARDEAKTLQAKIADELEPELSRFKASDYARDTYAEGARLRAEGDKALSGGDFPRARAQLTAAHAKLSEAVNVSRSFMIKITLASAKLFSEKSKWQLCVNEAKRVLEWDSDNAEALNLKEDAESHLVPSLKIIARIGDEEVEGATFSLAGVDCKTPEVCKNIEKGDEIGPFEVSYSRNGKNYIGTFSRVSVDWLGLNTIPVVLEEYTGPKTVKFDNGHKGVQLWGGGPYWAETNIGAENPWESGHYFWWGDTVGCKRVNDKWVASDGSGSSFSFDERYMPTYNKGLSILQSEGRITEDGVLAPKHDAVQAHWGGNWRMPARQEFEDLRDKCAWEWTKMNGVYGYRICGKGAYASASIFLPAAGRGNGTSLDYAGLYGYYWSSAPNSDNYFAWGLTFGSDYHIVYDIRYFGKSVRAVQGFTK